MIISSSPGNVNAQQQAKGRVDKRPGADYLFGESGTDTAVYWNKWLRVYTVTPGGAYPGDPNLVVNLSDPTQNRGSAAGDHDTLEGGAGDNTYKFGRDGGVDTIQDLGSASDNDVLRFGADIDADQLWLSYAGGFNDLKIEIVGTNDSIVIDNWFTGDAYEVDLELSDGRRLTETGVQQLGSESVLE